MRGHKSAERGRGLGPFSGRQLTLVICVVAVMVLLPAGAFAVVKGSNSFITDHSTGKTAKVNSAGQLSTAGTVSGTVNANVTGTVNANVNGTVHTAAPSTFAGGQVNATSTTGQMIIQGPAVLTSAHVDTFTSGAGAVQLHIAPHSDCSSSYAIDAVDHPPLGATVLTYGADGVAIPSGYYLCVVNTSPGTIGAAVFFFYHF